MNPNQPTHNMQAPIKDRTTLCGRNMLIGIVFALAEIERAHQGRDARSHVHHRAAGKIKAGEASAERGVQQSALAPDHVSHGRINHQRPERKKDHHAAELHAFGKGAGDQRRSDDGEHQLIDHEGLQRNGRGIVRIGRRADAMQKEVLKISDEAVAGAEGETEADNAPNHGHDGHHGKALHHGGQNIFLANQAAVKQRQTGPVIIRTSAALTSIHALSALLRASVTCF